jgi:ribosomal protein S27AE
MSIYRKIILMWVVILLLVLIIILGAKYISSIIPIMGFSLPFIIKRTLDKMKCPKCGMPVTYQGEIFGESYFGGFLNRKCKNCGWDLNKN